MDEKRKYRVSLAFMTFMDVEVSAVSSLAAEQLAQAGGGARVKFEAGPIIHRVEQSVPVPGAPGEYRWETVEERR